MAGRHGAYANRNRAHQERALTLVAQAGTPWERLIASYDGFRAAVRLLQKRRQPLGTPAGYNQAQAERLVADAADYLERLFKQIDAGVYDAAKEVA
jgi:hypothetical protein